MQQQAPGILYDTVAREWRCKVVSRECLGAVQSAWEALFSSRVRAVAGVLHVQRLCCGTCLDYKLLISVGAAQHSEWVQGTGGYEGCALGVLEAEFLGTIAAIEGVTDSIAQLYSIADA